tara:strand:+ start:374 stop:523 length:150 start_codon:yes stop_codon:yes gene_type:complete
MNEKFTEKCLIWIARALVAVFIFPLMIVAFFVENVIGGFLRWLDSLKRK